MVLDGNFNEAYQGYRALILDAKTDPRLAGNDLQQAVACLRNLDRESEADVLAEEAIALHGKDWRFLWKAAELYVNHLNHSGFIVAGQFYRGNHRGGGEYVNTWQRDRARGLQLMQQALTGAAEEGDGDAKGQFYLSLAQMVLQSGYGEAWRLQALTDLSVLPDYEQGWYYGGGTQGAPVDEQGVPIYHTVPASWQDAQSDGQRWRWCLVQAVEANARLLNSTRLSLANFCQSQFGEQTLASYGWYFGAGMVEGDSKDEGGTYALHTLDETETIARLATGIKRFKLPDEFNYIRIYQAVAGSGEKPADGDALATLGGIFENRRQYEKAADYWRKAAAANPGDPGRKNRVEQIVGNWGRFEGSTVQPAGQGAKVEFRFRNGKEVSFEAATIDVQKLLADVKAYLKGSPDQLDWQKLNINDLGWRMVEERPSQYVGKTVATWETGLEPRKAHWDRRVAVTTPLSKAGAYVLTAKMADGNTSKTILWVADTVIVKKPLSEKTLYFVADAVTGKPIAKANVEFFGYRQRQAGPNRFQVDTVNFAEFTDADGQVVLNVPQERNDFQWVVTATKDKVRHAYLGFTGMWRQSYYDAEYDQVKVFTITDRPVYRPDQEVKFKFWIRHAKYDLDEDRTFANQPFTVRIMDPQGEQVMETTLTSDDYGGLEGTWSVPGEAKLGVYQLMIVNHGGSSFRVEEYKKPEFEVTVEAPKEPVALGEKITATIQAKYYFGAPVTEARVKYKVLRSSYTESWYPIGRWDWLYGRGYWWFCYDCEWMPGWGRWGCVRPRGWWWPSYNPPEVVSEAEVPIGPDGTVKVEIDTAVAQALHPDKDHKYEITAEVVDRSRRTIVGQGNVSVAREPFKVFAWVDRGHYRVGDVVESQFSAHTLDQKPIQGKGRLRLLKISYDDKNEPVETEVEGWDLNTNDRGEASQQLKAAAAGQYRLSYTLSDAAGHSIEGGYLFVVMGEGFDGAGYRFNHIELVPDQREYRPGESVQLLINTDRVGSTVVLFTRPANGIYLPPRVVSLTGKSTVVPVEVIKKDMPNFYVEAFTIADGKLYSEMKEIVVPPEKRVLNVALEPTKTDYKPGEEAQVKLTLTGIDGKPFVGSTVLAMYDKAVEYISGGSNVPDIRDFFWKWRRSHYPSTESTLDRYFYNLIPFRQPGMEDLGIFGGSAVEEGGEFDRLAQTAEGAPAMRGAKMRAMPAAPGMAGAPMDAAPATELAASAWPGAGGSAGADLVQPTVRQNFADTAYWASSVTTDADGVAIASMSMPENLTTWKVKAWGMGHGTQVGEGDVEVITKKNLIVRLQAPRFFTEKDEVVLSANVHNYLASGKSAQVSLEVEGETLSPLDETVRTVEIAADGETRVDWRVKVAREGQAVVRMKALTDEESDAMQMSFPVFVHGMLKMDVVSGALRPDQDLGTFAVRVPAERRINDTRLEVRYSPTLAGAMVDALPYLVDYPYGCTEQTLNRFLPSVMTQKILLEMGLDLASIREKRTNLNAQELGDDAQRAGGWKRYEREPVFDEAELAKIVKEGVNRLTDMQLSDGGWGWFSGWGEHSDAHTTATVVHGLQMAVQNDVALVPGVLEKGVEWLKRYQAEETQKLKNFAAKTEPRKAQADAVDAFVYMVLVDADVANEEMRSYLYRDRVELPVYAKAMFGLALHTQQRNEDLEMILRNISQFVEQDDENQTAWLRLPEGGWWYWWGSEYEAHAYYLKLLTRTDSASPLLPRLVKYLLNNRKHATWWNSTRDTALCVEAFADYLKATGENKPDMTVEVWMDGQMKKEVPIKAENLFSFDNKFVLFGDAVETGMHEVQLKKKGSGALYYNAYVTNFTLEDHITAAGLEIKVNRKVYRLTRVDKTEIVPGSRGQALDQKVEKYERQEVTNLGTLTSGDLVEIELEIDSKNDYEYLVFEDPKAAGFEPFDVQSGYTGNALGAYMELRDEKVAFFVRRLARGKHSVAYRVRAEIPGRFSALPTRAYAMYAPELKGNSDEIKLNIADRPLEAAGGE
jgi:hypothetical protein